MRKPLITVLSIATLSLGGCSGNWLPETDLPDWATPDWVPGVFEVDVDQGNVVTQDMVNKLRPGMTKRQVRFVMGTPLLTDTFHPDRWDYVYRLHDGGKDPEQFRVTVLFDKGMLAGLDGDLRPQSLAEQNADPEPPREKTVVVPLEPPEKPGIFNSILRSVGLQDDYSSD